MTRNDERSQGEPTGAALGSRRGIDAVACLRAGVAAVDPESLVRAFVRSEPEAVGEGPLRLIAFGKAAAAMTEGLLGALDELGLDRPADAVAVVPEPLVDAVPPGVRAFGGGHPQPSAGSVEGAGAVREVAARAGAGETVVVLVSGGGSALLTLPPDGVSLADVQGTTRSLLRAGATIDETNAVRKHLDQLKGGRLARLCAPARVVALVLSDVVGDPLDVIASGPVSPDPTTYADALEVIDRYSLRDALPAPVREHLEAGADESPDGSDPRFACVRAEVVGSNRIAADAVLAEASRRGYRTLLLTTTLTGEAREAGRMLAAIGREASSSGRPVAPPAAILAAGETTVTVRGRGRGGRNQELALGAALALAPDAAPITVATLGTDGIDGPTDAAGAVADTSTVSRAGDVGVDAAAFLADNDAYAFFGTLGDLVVTGPTGTNVMDLSLVLVGSPEGGTPSTQTGSK